jgi:hypothetical protein
MADAPVLRVVIEAGFDRAPWLPEPPAAIAAADFDAHLDGHLALFRIVADLAADAGAAPKVKPLAIEPGRGAGRGEFAEQILALHGAAHLLRRTLTSDQNGGVTAEEIAAARLAEDLALQKLTTWGIEDRRLRTERSLRSLCDPCSVTSGRVVCHGAPSGRQSDY